MHLTVCADDREKMIKEKAIESLMKLAELSDPNVRVMVALALSNLCCTVEARRLVIGSLCRVPADIRARGYLQRPYALEELLTSS